MNIVSHEICSAMESSSFIRKMFEKGIELKKRFGEEAVCDFSLGNPDVPPPAKTVQVLASLAADAVKPLGLGYCPNAGIPSVREAMARKLSTQQETDLAAKDVVMTVGAAGAMVAILCRIWILLRTFRRRSQNRSFPASVFPSRHRRYCRCDNHEDARNNRELAKQPDGMHLSFGRCRRNRGYSRQGERKAGA